MVFFIFVGSGRVSSIDGLMESVLDFSCVRIVFLIWVANGCQSAKRLLLCVIIIVELFIMMVSIFFNSKSAVGSGESMVSWVLSYY